MIVERDSHGRVLVLATNGHLLPPPLSTLSMRRVVEI
jgi:hypothetical protein